jgi:chemotaxis protein methyltransferase CheR
MSSIALNTMTELEQNELDAVIRCVKDYRGVDFSEYAQGSLNRRVMRFFEINRLSGLSEFQQRVRTDREFGDFFINEITVNVTEMFRDPTFWVCIRDSVLPALSDRPVIRIWHAACSTGEEVFSMGILLREAGLEDKTRIVATDLNETALEQAQTGVFKLKSQILNHKNYGALNGKNDLALYYRTEGNNVIYDSSLIRNVKFLKHDLTSEQQPAKFDLIICRNVLIYFSFSLQDRVLQHFYDSLKSDSFLGIGSKESIYRTKIEKLVEIESYEEKIFRKP